MDETIFFIEAFKKVHTEFRLCNRNNYDMQRKYKWPRVFFRLVDSNIEMYEGWNFNSGNYLFATDTK